MPFSALKNELSTSFTSLGHPPLKINLLTKLAHLSSSLNLTAAQLVESWEAHSLTRGVDTLSDSTFAGFESSIKADKRANTVVVTTTSLGKRQGGIVTPSPAPKKPFDARSGLSAVDSLSPVKASPSAIVIVTPRAETPRYSDRSGSGVTVESYNAHLEPRGPTVGRRCVVSVHGAGSHAGTGQRHMFSSIHARSRSLENRLGSMNAAMCEKYSWMEREEFPEEEEEGHTASWTAVGVPSQSEIFCVGRICNEAHEGRLNDASIKLEGSRLYSSGSRISVELSPDLSYSLFPGQIVGMQGQNPSGRIIRPVQLFEGIDPPVEKCKARDLLTYHYGEDYMDGKPLSVVSMCGPFTTSEDLEYTPLLDAVLMISQEKPDVVILCGPFVDSRQPLIKDGETTILEDGVTKKVSFDDLFRVKLSELLMEMYENDAHLQTQFVLVPSVDDAICESVFPQPPLVDGEVVSKRIEFGSLGLNDLELAGREGSKNQPTRVHCVSNPCTLKINEVIVGITSTDILFHINCDVVNANLPPSGRLARIAQHLIQQRSYYPLFPAAKGACLDLSRSDQWEMPVQPDILIVPSKLKPFAKQVMNKSVVVNPGLLTKNATGGTYAVIEVHPMKRDLLESGVAAEAELEHAVQDRVRVDIKRI